MVEHALWGPLWNTFAELGERNHVIAYYVDASGGATARDAIAQAPGDGAGWRPRAVEGP